MRALYFLSIGRSFFSPQPRVGHFAARREISDRDRQSLDITSLSYRSIRNERLGGMSRRLNVRAQTNRYLIARRARAHVHVHVRAARARNTCHVLATSGAHTRGEYLYVRTREHTLDVESRLISF